MKRRFNIFFSTFLLLAFYGFDSLSQVTVRLVVTDSLTKKTMSNASIKVEDDISNKLIIGVTGQDGYYVTPCAKGHLVTVTVSFLNYKTKVETLKISSDSTLNFLLKANVIQLGQVEINGRKNIEFKEDRIIYNVDQKSEKGKNVSDIIRKVPFVSLVGNNLLIKGNSKFQLLQNGQPTTLSVGELNNISSSRIESIEVITAPSAKFEGQYDNILNIKFKRNDNYIGGVSYVRIGSRNSSIGTTLTNSSIKASTNLSFSLSYDIYKAESSTHTSLFEDTIFNIYQNGKTSTKTPSFTGQYKTELTLSKDQYLGIGVNFTLQNNKTNSFYTSEIDPIKLLYISDNRTRTKAFNVGFDLDYTKKISKTNTVFVSNLLTSLNNNYNLYSINTTESFKDLNLNKNLEVTSSLDDEQNFVNNIKLQVGLKYILRSYNNYPDFIDSIHRILHFTQNIYESYASLSKNYKKFYFRFGTRLEETVNDYYNEHTTQFNLLPNVFISFKPNPLSNYSIFYRRSLTRPNYLLLSTFPNRSISLNETVGNPTLTNSFYDNFKLGDDKSIGNGNLSFSLNYNVGHNLLTSRRTVGSYFTTVSYDNLSNSNSIGTDISYSSSLLKNKIYLNLSTNIYYTKVVNSIESNSGLVFNNSLGISYNPSSRYSFDFFVHYLDNTISLETKTGNTLFSDFSFRYQIKKTSILLQITNPILNEINESIKAQAPQYLQSGHNYYLGRSFGIGYAYSFGRKKEGDSKTKAVQNNDISNDKINRKL